MTRNRRGAGLSPFLEAAESGNWELAFHYLGRGADPNERAPDGKTALHYACEQHRPDWAQRLFAAGVRPFLRDRRGNSAAFWALKRRWRPLLKSFLQAPGGKAEGKRLAKIARNRAAHDWLAALSDAGVPLPGDVEMRLERAVKAVSACLLTLAVSALLCRNMDDARHLAWVALVALCVSFPFLALFAVSKEKFAGPDAALISATLGSLLGGILGVLSLDVPFMGLAFVGLGATVAAAWMGASGVRPGKDAGLRVGWRVGAALGVAVVGVFSYNEEFTLRASVSACIGAGFGAAWGAVYAGVLPWSILVLGFCLRNRRLPRGGLLRPFVLGRGPSAMAKAAQSGDAEWVAYLLDSGFEAGGGVSEPLVAAMAANRSAVVKALIDGGAPVNTSYSLPEKNENVLFEPLEKPENGVVVFSPLHFWAAKRDSDVQIGRLLLDAGADPDAVDHFGSPALHYAAAAPHPAAVGLLIFAQARLNAVNGAGEAAMHFAASSGSVETLKMLLDAGAELNARDEDGRNPLNWAALWGRAEAVDFLLASGLAPDEQDGAGMTALHQAAHAGCAPAVAALLNAGADVFAVSGADGLRPVFYAAASGDVETIEAVLRAGEDPKSVTSQGNTLLHFAAESGSAAAVRYLLLLGLDPDVQNADGHTPLYRAQARSRYGYEEVVNALKNAANGS